jgi:hypothetical protein
MISTVNTFNNFGFIAIQLSEDAISPIKEEINLIRENFDTSTKHNPNLAGNISKEFTLIKSAKYIERLILPYILDYDKEFNLLQDYNFLSKSCPIILETAWVNFQKKYEFNPVHNHTGIMSFVIWINIPYNLKEEMTNAPGATSNKNVPGAFEFQYTSTLGNVCAHTIHVDKSLENALIVFPAKLCHTVYPFYTSDDYRISVSGNFKFKTD